MTTPRKGARSAGKGLGSGGNNRGRVKARLERQAAAQRAERTLLGGMSRRDLAAKARLNHSHVCRALRGERRLSADAVEKVAKAAGLSMDETHGLLRTIVSAAAD